MPRRTSTRIIASLAIALISAAAVFGVLMLRDSGNASAPNAADAIWSTGDTWVVTERQNTGAVAPGGAAAGTTTTLVYTFRVVEHNDDGTWTVRVTLANAEGPSAEGWTLTYDQQDDGSMVFATGAPGKQAAARDASIALVALGIPARDRYTAKPADETLDASVPTNDVLPPEGDLPFEEGGQQGQAPDLPDAADGPTLPNS